MYRIDKAAERNRLIRTSAAYLIPCILLFYSGYTHAQQTDDCADTGAICTTLPAILPQLSEVRSNQLTAASGPDKSITSLLGPDNSSVNAVTDLLLPHAGSDKSTRSTSRSIAETCLSGNISSRAQADCHALVKAALQEDTHISSALLQISPRFATTTNSTARAGSVSQIKNLQTRISALRAGSRGLSLQGLDLHIYKQKLPIGKIGQAYEKKRTQGSGLRKLVDSSFGLFITGKIITNKDSINNPESKLNFDTNGVTFGTDYRLSKRLIIGSALGYINTDNHLSYNTGDLGTRGYSLSLFGTYFGRNRYFLDFAASYGQNSIEQRRIVNYQLDGADRVNQAFIANYNSNKFTLFFGTGYDFKNNLMRFKPRMDLKYINSDIDGYEEVSTTPNAAGNDWATHSDAVSRHWLTWNLGGKFSYIHDMPWGSLEPYSELDWLHEFKNDSQVLNASFLHGSDNNAIQITTSDPDRNYLRLKVGTTAKFKRGIEAYFKYGTLLAHSDWTGQTVKIGFRMKL